MTTETNKIGKLYSQAQTVNLLRHEGFNITERTLRFWREEGYIPALEREGLTYYYSHDDVDAIRIYAQTRDRAPEETLLIHEVEGRLFNVTGIEIVRMNGRLRLLMHLRREGVLVKDITEEEVHAIARGN